MREDNGFTASELWGIAWALGVLAGIAWVRAAFLMDHPHPLSRELGLWVGAAVLASAFSAACTILIGVKNAARRQIAALDPADG